MKKQEKIQNLKNDIKKLTKELKETKELLKIVVNSALKWKNKYKEIKRDYTNLINEKQMFIGTKPEKIINVEIKGDIIFNPNNNFYNSNFLDNSNIFNTNSEIQIEKSKIDESEQKQKTINNKTEVEKSKIDESEIKKEIPFKKANLTKKETDVYNEYKEIDDDESDSLLQELNISSDEDISLQYYSKNNSNSLINPYESDEMLIKKKRKRKKKY